MAQFLLYTHLPVLSNAGHKHPRRLVESAGVSNLGVFLGLCGGLFRRQSEMRGPLAQQRGLAKVRRGGDQRQLARHTLIQSFGQARAVILPHLVHPGNVATCLRAYTSQVADEFWVP
jgi:hypothetical protein